MKNYLMLLQNHLDLQAKHHSIGQQSLNMNCFSKDFESRKMMNRLL